MTKANAKMDERGHRFSEEERRGLYRAIYERRDVRSLFRPDEISDEVLGRLLDAAHHAPSAGLMQPWRFIVIRDRDVRQTIHEIFHRARRSAAHTYTDYRRPTYDALNLAGIL